MAARKIVRRSCLGARPRYNLVVDEDVKKPTKPNQANVNLKMVEKDNLGQGMLPVIFLFPSDVRVWQHCAC